MKTKNILPVRREFFFDLLIPHLGAELCSGNSIRVKRTYISMPVPTFWFCEFE